MSRRIAVAMSGGVDSSTAAGLLVEQGEQVFGIMLRLWSPSSAIRNRCCSPESMALARRVAARLDIPFYVVDARTSFKRAVVEYFIDGYLSGITPNPCIRCNQDIRWTLMLQQALAMGATHMATGHYAQLRNNGQVVELLRGADLAKDQSYVLSFLGQAQLRRTVFPLGSLSKPEVREHARRLNLPVADRHDSQDLCFVGDLDYREFLQDTGAELPPAGPIIDRQGNVLGRHEGLHRYTIGQRRGLGISASEPLYVIRKEPLGNRLVVGPRIALGRSEFHADRVNWVAPSPPLDPLEASVQVRYNGQEVPATIIPQSAESVRVELHSPLVNVTPGQGSVFYQGERCLGGGVIRA
jgi:tRNA-specific 2-thiouridylase